MLGIRLRNDWVYYALFQYFWILVILPKAVQLVCLGGLLCLMWFKSGREKPLNSFTVSQLVFLLIYGVAIAVNTLTEEHELSRVLAAVNTWMITAVAVFMYHLYSGAQVDPRRMGKYALMDLLILIFFWLVYFLTRGHYAFGILGHTLTGDDWVNGMYTPRFLGYMDYANLVVFAVLFFYPLALYFLKGKKLAALALTLVLFPVVDATNSRTGLVLYLLIIMAYFFFEMQKRFFEFYRKRKYALFAVAILAVLVVAVVGFSLIVRILEEIMGMREGSNSMRTAIYTHSLQIMWEKSPIIGIGIKDMLGGYPLGSHSTYIGVFYKTGILGGILYIVTMLGKGISSLLGKDADRRTVVLKICILACMLMMVFEDIDGANWCICIFYVLLALVQHPCLTESTQARNEQ